MVLDFFANLLVRDRSCAVHGEVIGSNSLWTRASRAAILTSSSSAATIQLPLALPLSYRRTRSSHFSSPVGSSCRLHRFGTRICRRSVRFPPVRRSQRRIGLRSASSPDEVAPTTMSKLSPSASNRSATSSCAFFLQDFVHAFVSQCPIVIRDDIVVVFHPLDHLSKTWSRTPQSGTLACCFAAPGGCVGHPCSNSLSDCVGNLRQLWSASASGRLVVCAPWFNICCCPCSWLGDHLHEILYGRHCGFSVAVLSSRELLAACSLRSCPHGQKTQRPEERSSATTM